MAEVFLERAYLPLVVGCIKESRQGILVCTYEWAWYDGQRTGTVQDVNRTLCQAAQRGVLVQALMHNEPPGRPLGKINRKAAGRLRRNGVEVKLGGTARIIHAKFWVFDDEKAIVCTHNISRRATSSNVEVGVLLDDYKNVSTLRDYFWRLWAGVPARATKLGAEDPRLASGPVG